MHGSLTRAGKVRKQTPKVDKKERFKKVKVGRSRKRLQYNKRYANVVVGRRKVGPNAQRK